MMSTETQTSYFKTLQNDQVMDQLIKAMYNINKILCIQYKLEHSIRNRNQ
jgi:hypothetical protein